MQEQLRAFVERHPDGWNHEDWLGLLAELRQAGTATADEEAIGTELERVRLESVLETRSVKGLGPKRKEALVARFPTLWDLRQASVDDLAGVPAIPRSLAQQIVRAIH